MKSFLFGLSACLLVGCAAPVYNVDLETADNGARFKNVRVHDKRLDEKVYMTGLSIAGTHIYMFEVNPPLKTTLEGLVNSELVSTRLNAEFDINIHELDIKNQVGFATADKLSCVFESSVTMGESTESMTVRTITRNNEFRSSLLSTVGKLIIDQCLKEHAQDLAKFIEKSDSKSLNNN